MIIISGRCRGKTTKLIQESSKTGRYILVKSRSEAKIVSQMARDLGLSIPYPVTLYEITAGRIDGSSILRDGILVDNGISILERLLGTKVMGISLDQERK